MSGHTPGPWEVLPIREDARGFRVREIHHRSEFVSGGVHVEVHELGNRWALARLEADARLIAAAPDLLEALRVALVAMQANIAFATRKDEFALARGIDAARAAIAKADGKS